MLELQFGHTHGIVESKILSCKVGCYAGFICSKAPMTGLQVLKSRQVSPFPFRKKDCYSIVALKAQRRYFGTRLRIN